MQTKWAIRFLLVSVRHVIQKKSDCMPLVITNDLIDLYIFNITRMTFPDIPHDIDRVECFTIIDKCAEQSSALT